jgi:hypothetical protein
LFAVLKDAFHILGISSLFSAAAIMCWVFYEISAQGYLIVCENNLLIRYSECVLVGFGVIYALYLLVAYVRSKLDPSNNKTNGLSR